MAQEDPHYRTPEFSKEADSLIERIRKYRTEHGDSTDKDSILEVAVDILKDRLDV